LSFGSTTQELSVKKTNPFLRHKGVDIYESFKGSESYRWWYGLGPRLQVEGSDEVFDVRRLPKKYRSGLVISSNQTYDFPLSELDLERYLMALDTEREAHKIAMQRAVDDGYDFKLATRGNYGQLLRRLISWIRATTKSKGLA
jgi:hypothetical protein